MATIDSLMTPGGIPANITTSTFTPDAPVVASGNPVATEGTYPVDVVDVLNDLLENAHDGDYGFTACAEEADDASQLRPVFSARATQCRAAAGELIGLILHYGGKPVDGGTTSGALHRAWMHTKAAVGANSAASLLEECERGEDAALARYRKALKAELPADVRSLVERQAQGAQRNHDQIKSLRDQARAAD